MKIPFKALETAEFSIAHPKRELALQEKKQNRRQTYIWRSCSSFLVGVCCFLILLLIQRTRLGKHIVGMFVLTKGNLVCSCNCMMDGANLLLKQT